MLILASLTVEVWTQRLVGERELLDTEVVEEDLLQIQRVKYFYKITQFSL